MKQLKVENGQSVYDLCNSAYGTQDQLVRLCRDNGITDMNAPVPVTTVQYDETLVALQGVRTGYATLVVQGECSLITGLAVSAVDDSSFTVSWRNTPQLRYEYAYNDTGDTPTVWNSTGSNERTITELDAATTYYFFVRNDCAGTYSEPVVIEIETTA